MAIPQQKHLKPKRMNMFFRTILKLASVPDLKAVNFKYNSIGMERLKKNEPCLILMNHSSFIDLKIASTILYPRCFNIVCTSDGFVGKNRFMRNLGCIPTKKFVTDMVLVRDVLYAVKTLKSSVLMFPEASYSFDGTATPLPDTIGKLLKHLNIPVVLIHTYGAFSRDPLYNGLKRRKVNVSASIEYVLSPEDITQKSPQQLNEIIKQHFTFDNFKWQQKNSILITEPFRADGLNRVLYKCPHCLSEGNMLGKGIKLTCLSCKKSYTLKENGFLAADNGNTEFSHIPDWYNWQRECIKKDLLNSSYSLKVDVDICVMVNTKCIYRVGSGVLYHTNNGFKLVGCNGKLTYTQSPLASYSLYSDFFWYETGDMICIGNNRVLYYCFPKQADVCAKARLATEELYKIAKSKSQAKN